MGRPWSLARDRPSSFRSPELITGRPPVHVLSHRGLGSSSVPVLANLETEIPATPAAATGPELDRAVLYDLRRRPARQAPASGELRVESPQRQVPVLVPQPRRYLVRRPQPSVGRGQFCVKAQYGAPDQVPNSPRPHHRSPASSHLTRTCLNMKSNLLCASRAVVVFPYYGDGRATRLGAPIFGSHRLLPAGAVVQPAGTVACQPEPAMLGDGRLKLVS